MQNKLSWLACAAGMLSLAVAASAADTAAPAKAPATPASLAKPAAQPAPATFAKAATPASSTASATSAATASPATPATQATQASSAAATTPATQAVGAGGLADMLSKIEAETLVLKARERQLGVQVAILARQQEISARQDGTARATQAPPVAQPVVHAIEGIGANQYATLELDNGSRADVRAGDMLSNGMRVVAVQGGAVTVQTAGKKRIQLRAAAQAPSIAGLPLPRALPGVAGEP